MSSPRKCQGLGSLPLSGDTKSPEGLGPSFLVSTVLDDRSGPTVWPDLEKRWPLVTSQEAPGKGHFHHPGCGDAGQLDSERPWAACPVL